jgi:hypothetical protein
MLVAVALPDMARAVALACPSGTQAQSSTLPPPQARGEWCADATGLREGPFQALNPDGSVAWHGTYLHGHKQGAVHYYINGKPELDITYEADHEVARHFHIDGLRGMMERRNQAERQAGGNLTVTVVDEHTLQFERTGQDPATVRATDKQELRRALSQNELCRLFHAPGTQFELIRVRYTSAHGATLFETTFTPRDCAPATSPESASPQSTHPA